MKVLIVGLGYAGQRYHRAFTHLAQRLKLDIEIAYVGRRRRRLVGIPYFNRVALGLELFQPNVVVVSVNDHQHIDILRELDGFQGFIICEKPMVAPGDAWERVGHGLSQAQGFALDMVERYSEATRKLKIEVERGCWSLVRASFHWGKNRLNDYRPTCGVASEVIHALDLVSWIYPGEALHLRHVLGIASDFSISGQEVLDTVMLTASLGDAPVAGYSSFVNLQRQRTLEFSFIDADMRVIHARIVYDTPTWDCDHLRIWTRNAKGGGVLICDISTEHATAEPELLTVRKLSSLCEDVVRVVALDLPPRQPFVDFAAASNLQRLLDEISLTTMLSVPARYLRGAERQLLPEDSDLEILG